MNTKHICHICLFSMWKQYSVTWLWQNGSICDVSSTSTIN